MALRAPRGELDRRYSSDRATPAPWARARKELETAKSYWLSTVRPERAPARDDGRGRLAGRRGALHHRRARAQGEEFREESLLHRHHWLPGPQGPRPGRRRKGDAGGDGARATRAPRGERTA